jgi:hypothetical protein
MKKQVVQAAGNTDQAYDQQNNAAPRGPALSDRFFFI